MKNTKKLKFRWTIALVGTSKFSTLVNDYTDNTSEHKGNEVIQDDNEAHNSDNVCHEKEDHVESAEASAKPVLLKHEKPKLPCFFGDVRYF